MINLGYKVEESEDDVALDVEPNVCRMAYRFGQCRDCQISSLEFIDYCRIFKREVTGYENSETTN